MKKGIEWSKHDELLKGAELMPSDVEQIRDMEFLKEKPQRVRRVIWRVARIIKAT